MYRVPILLPLWLCLALLPLPLSAAEYTVVLDGRSYEVQDGVPRTVTLPQGTALQVEVRKKELLRYRQHGLSFRYRSDMTLTEAKEPQARILSLECADSTLVMLYQQRQPVNADEAAGGVLQDVQQQFIQSGVTYPDGSLYASTRVIAGEIVSGQRLLTHLGTALIETEAYGLRRQGQTLVVLFQADQQDRPRAENYFKVVADSLALTAAP